jgi:hypothetical protein
MKSELADWEAFFNEGLSYHKTAQRSVRRPEIFTPEIIQNIVAMGIEKYFMAIFMHRGSLPRNHTMTDLFSEANSFLQIPEDLSKTLLYMDSLQRICSIDDFSIEKPKTTDVPRFLSALEGVALLAAESLGRDIDLG